MQTVCEHCQYIINQGTLSQNKQSFGYNFSNLGEVEQVKLVLDGRAREGSVIEQRKRYWFALNEFWKTDRDLEQSFPQKV